MGRLSPSVNHHRKLRDLRFDNVPFGRTQFAPTLWTKSVTVGAQSLRPPSDWDIIPTQVPNANGSEAQTHFNRLSLRLVESPQPPRHRGVLPLAPSQLTI
jgi:hypothetical protein